MESELKFDGYYFCFKKEENILDSCNSVMRFYKDGKKVISVPVALQNYDKTNKIESYTLNQFFPKDTWFNESYEDNGTYEITGNHIKFKCDFVLYDGTISGNNLELFWHSNYNGKEGNETYKFISFDELNSQKINLLQYFAANN